jgi:Glycosyltransferase family 87
MPDLRPISACRTCTQSKSLLDLCLGRTTASSWRGERSYTYDGAVARAGATHALPALSMTPEKSAAAIDWRRLRRRAFIGAALAAASVQMYYSASGHQYGLDFRGGTWHAGWAVLQGHSPYPPPVTGLRLLLGPSSFMNPPLLALIGIPFSLLPFWTGIATFNVVCAGALVASLRSLGINDRRLYLLVLCSLPFITSLALGQPDGLLALPAAAAWRWRDDSSRGAVAVGVLIAAKLLAWPLIIWLIATRRSRQAAVAAGSTAVILAASWACIGFKGLAAYPRLLAADARVYENVCHSLVTGFMHLGLPAGAAVLLALVTAAAVGAGVVRIGHGGDAAWFTAAIVAGVLSSPIVWDHYLLLLFICLAASCGLRDPSSWLLVAALWLCPTENPPTLWQAWLVPVLASAIALRAAFLSRSAGDVARGGSLDLGSTVV